MQNIPELEPLVRGTSRGDRKSEERLFAILYKFAHAVIRRKWRGSLSDDETSDIGLDTLEKLLATFRNPEKAEKVIEGGRIFGFVHVVAENTALDYNRKRGRREKVFISLDELIESDDDPNWERKAGSVAATADLSDFILGGMETARILSQLDGKYRQVLELRISGADYDEIAEKMDISSANARQIHKRGVTTLRQKLIEKNKSVLSGLTPSQNTLLRRLYLKEDSTREDSAVTEDEALSAFYMALMNNGRI